MLELEELMKLLKVNNQMVDPTPVVVQQQPPPGPQQHFYSPQRPPSQTGGGRMGSGVGGPRVIVSPATVGMGKKFMPLKNRTSSC